MKLIALSFVVAVITSAAAQNNVAEPLTTPTATASPTTPATTATPIATPVVTPVATATPAATVKASPTLPSPPTILTPPLASSPPPVVPSPPPPPGEFYNDLNLLLLPSRVPFHWLTEHQCLEIAYRPITASPSRRCRKPEDSRAFCDRLDWLRSPIIQLHTRRQVHCCNDPGAW